MAKISMKVWDPLVRIGHWTLVAAFVVAYFSEEELINIHVWAGYVVGVYVIVRIVWGVVGSRYARFSQFFYSPPKVIEYLKQLAAGEAQHYIGHNPAGGVMVIALICCLSATTLTGLKLYAVESNKGPFANTMEPLTLQNHSQKNKPLPRLKGRETNDEESIQSENNRKAKKAGEEYWEELHELFVNLTLFLIFVHIMGVAISSHVDNEKLIEAMLTGKKDVDDTYQ